MATPKLYNADCMEILKQIPDSSIDLILTDPPYNISGNTRLHRMSSTGKAMDIDMDFGEWDYNFDPVPFLEESKRVLNDYGSIIVWTSEQLYGTYRNWCEENMYPKQLLVWVKQNPVPQFRKVGYRQATELAFWASKGKLGKDNPNFIFQTQQEMTNVFLAPVVAGDERTEHPTQKPLSIFTQLVNTHCRKGGIVLDPFMGSGTTGVAAISAEREFIGIELDEKYFEIAKARIGKATRKAEARLW